MHELKQLVDDRFEEPPVGPQEAGVLSHHVHDVGSHNGLVVLAPLLFTQPKQVLFYEKHVHVCFQHCTTKNFRSL